MLNRQRIKSLQNKKKQINNNIIINSLKMAFKKHSEKQQNPSYNKLVTLSQSSNKLILFKKKNKKNRKIQQLEQVKGVIGNRYFNQKVTFESIESQKQRTLSFQPIQEKYNDEEKIGGEQSDPCQKTFGKATKDRRKFYSQFFRPKSKICSRSDIRNIINNDNNLKEYLSTPKKLARNTNFPEILKLSINYNDSLHGSSLQLQKRQVSAQRQKGKYVQRKNNKQKSIFSSIKLEDIALNEEKEKRKGAKMGFEANPFSPWATNSIKKI